MDANGDAEVDGAGWCLGRLYEGLKEEFISWFGDGMGW